MALPLGLTLFSVVPPLSEPPLTGDATAYVLACFPACAKRAKASKSSTCSAKAHALKRSGVAKRGLGSGRRGERFTLHLAFTAVWGVLERHIKLMSRQSNFSLLLGARLQVAGRGGGGEGSLHFLIDCMCILCLADCKWRKGADPIPPALPAVSASLSSSPAPGHKCLSPHTQQLLHQSNHTHTHRAHSSVETPKLFSIFAQQA